MNPRNFRRHVLACNLKNEKLKQIELENNEIVEEDFEESANSSESSSDMFENNFLKSFCLVINSKYHLLICKICKYVLEEDSVFNHLSRNHRLLIDWLNSGDGQQSKTGVDFVSTPHKLQQDLIIK